MLRRYLRRILQKAGWDIHRVVPAEPSTLDRVNVYHQNGRVPWSTGYQETRDLFLEEALHNTPLLDAFRRNEALPSGYGTGIDERVVEYPWMYSRLPLGGGRVLDAGSVFNYDFLIPLPLIRTKTLHILTLVPEGHCHCIHGVSHLYSDLRSIPIVSDYYDVVACISTLEHIGMDNSAFHAGVEDAPDDYLIAVREMRRVLRPRGECLLTVPFGRYANFGSFQLFDERLVENVIAAFAPSHVEETYFRYTSQGWCLSDSRECAGAEYVPWVMQSPKDRPTQYPVQPDNAAAARAVACLRMIK